MVREKSKGIEHIYTTYCTNNKVAWVEEERGLKWPLFPVTRRRASPYLLSAVDDVLGVGQAVDAGPANHRVVSGGGVGHLHGAELEEGLPQGHPAEQHLSVGAEGDIGGGCGESGRSKG